MNNVRNLKRLCLNAEGSGILKNQMEITKDLYKNHLIPLKFGIDNNNNKPYMVYQLNEEDNDDFFIQNPSLKEIKIENNDNVNLPTFYYSSFTNKYDIFINYICAILDLYYASCASRNEAKDITAFDTSENAKNLALYYANYFKANNINYISGDDNWLKNEEDNKYDGIICSNVLDVLPIEISKDIIKNLYRIAKKDALVIIGLNYYVDEKINISGYEGVFDSFNCLCFFTFENIFDIKKKSIPTNFYTNFQNKILENFTSFKEK